MKIIIVNTIILYLVLVKIQAFYRIKSFDILISYKVYKDTKPYILYILYLILCNMLYIVPKR